MQDAEGDPGSSQEAAAEAVGQRGRAGDGGGGRGRDPPGGGGGGSMSADASPGGSGPPPPWAQALEGFVEQADGSGYLFNASLGYYFDPATALFGDAATGVWYRHTSHSGYQPVQ